MNTIKKMSVKLYNQGKKDWAEVETDRAATLKFQETKSLKIKKMLEHFKMKLIHIPAKENLHMTDHQETIQGQNCTA
jgi:hypothetical protein